jgi:hypothetical protein
MTRLPACQSGIRHPDTWHSRDPEEQAEARAVCLACPTRLVCQAAVLGVERGWPAIDRHGIWAALDGEQRADLDPTTPAASGPAPRYVQLAEDTAWLERHGVPRTQVPDRLGVSRDYLNKSLTRYEAVRGQQAAA